jgi:hypothetical protein
MRDSFVDRDSNLNFAFAITDNIHGTGRLNNPFRTGIEVMARDCILGFQMTIQYVAASKLIGLRISQNRLQQNETKHITYHASNSHKQRALGLQSIKFSGKQPGIDRVVRLNTPQTPEILHIYLRVQCILVEGLQLTNSKPQVRAKRFQMQEFRAHRGAISLALDFYLDMIRRPAYTWRIV